MTKESEASRSKYESRINELDLIIKRLSE